MHGARRSSVKKLIRAHRACKPFRACKGRVVHSRFIVSGRSRSPKLKKARAHPPSRLNTRNQRQRD
ncbi:hypothetical protein BX600DRAFT_458491 [Xylariales sp. PMI_506]|nr:hypothetical protein BX600DRAFT_458491 [Xylariales sp. PMI_506]